MEYCLASSAVIPNTLKHIKDLHVDIGIYERCRAVHHAKNGN